MLALSSCEECLTSVMSHDCHASVLSCPLAMIIAMIANSYILAIIEQRRNKVVISCRSLGNVDTDNRKVNNVFKYL